jgi:hypothetical protein
MTMIPMNKTVVAPGGITGNGNVIVVENNSDNSLVTFRFKNPSVKMSAAEDAFTADGRSFAPGAIIIENANRAQLDPSLKSLGLTAVAVASRAECEGARLDIPRIGYIHSWTRTQDEGWVRAALDTYGVPISISARTRSRRWATCARSSTSFSIRTAAAASAAARARVVARGEHPRALQEHEGIPVARLPRLDRRRARRARRRWHEGALRVHPEGGTLITEGNTSEILPDMNLTTGVKSEQTPACSRAARSSAASSPTRRARSSTATTATKCRSTSRSVPVLNASNLGACRSPRCAAARRRGGSSRAEHDADGESAQALAVGSGQDGHGLRSGDEHRQ